MKRRVPLAIAAAASAVLLAAPSSSAVVSKPTDKAKLAALTKELAALDKELGGDLADLEDLKDSAQKAVQRKDDLKEELGKSQSVVSRLAAGRYMNQGLDPSMSVLQTGDPAVALQNAGLAQWMQNNESARVGQIQAVVNLQVKAAKDATYKLNKLQRAVNDMKSRKAEIKKLIEKFQPSPIIGNSSLTPRLVSMRDALIAAKGPFLMIGCLRPGDPQDHGSGRACDFMESTGGRMPTADHIAHGNDVLKWALANASKYGIKYVIWRQRYYDAQSGSNKVMSDRGSITQNHYDHVHISVF
ncbi:hypothetical protein GCM10010468_53520 [Actinocorallia longicatena]|uniref:ARB-07466-like C-terminal domain-containing protein n=2 Tax=Actinocorallia longicatena TaxID=111803 RepID=A0ABP6QG58_9ACTN